MRISDWSSDVCSSDLITRRLSAPAAALMVLTPNPVAASILGVSDKHRPAVLYRESDMPRPVIPGRSINADDYQHAPRSVAAMPKDYAPGEEIGRAHSELQSLMRTAYAVFCLKKKKKIYTKTTKLLVKYT